MLIKYCPVCASLKLERGEEPGKYRCVMCGWTGKPKLGRMDEINEFRASLISDKKDKKKKKR